MRVWARSAKVVVVANVGVFRSLWWRRVGRNQPFTEM